MIWKESIVRYITGKLFLIWPSGSYVVQRKMFKEAQTDGGRVITKADIEPLAQVS